MTDPLTPREMEILQLIGQGMTNEQIADALVLSRGTVKAHSHNIYGKLGVTNRTQAVLKAAEVGLLPIDALTSVASPADIPASDLRHLPTELNPLIGRQSELDKLSALFLRERVRFITLLGTGGMGKTKLAVALCEQIGAHFADGTAFVSLADVAESQDIAQAILDALDLRIQSNERAEQQLLRVLADRHLLLVLDNFEHLMDGVDLIRMILQSAPDVAVLVTSRERLNLSSELVFVLGGLHYQAGDPAADAGHGDAARLFLDRARLVNPTWEPLPDDLHELQQICVLTGGLPLALILAASWMPLLTIQEIAGQLATNLDLLESRFRDLPARQRSMRAMIASSLSQLSYEEQGTFASLSVFRGGFTWQAAQYVAGARLSHLQTLLDRSLMRVRDGRHSIHELIRQYAETQLGRSSAVMQHVHEKHCAYYAAFLERAYPDLVSGQRLSVLTELVTETDNIRAAWRWALDQIDLGALARMAPALSLFFHVRSRYREGCLLFEQAVEHLVGISSSAERDWVLGVLTDELGYLLIRLGRLDEAEHCFEQARACFQSAERRPGATTTDPLFGLGLCASIRGDYERAAARVEEALESYLTVDDLSNRAYVLYLRAGIRLAWGEYPAALEDARQGVAIAEQVQDRWLMQLCLFEKGHVLRMMGESEAARLCYESSHQIAHDYGDIGGMASAANHLGQLALERGDFAEAQRLCQRSLHLYRTTHDQGGIAAALHGLGQIALGMDDLWSCRDYLQQALHAVETVHYVPLLFAALLTVAQWKLRTGHLDSGLRLIQYIRRHPSCNQHTRDRAERLLAEHGALDVTPLQVDLQGVVGQVRAEIV
ncbi:MAG: LuxR C-terminal-related transcriptional regulator [Anaerolineae bacterium]